MEFKAPDLSFMEIKSARGFVGDAYLSRSDVFPSGILELLKEEVTLKAGEETPVPVAVPGLPPNANVNNITAKLTVVDDQHAGAAQTTSVAVTEGSDKRAFQVAVDAVAGLRNVQIRLNQGSALWIHAGLVKADTYTIPDFSAQANAYLDKYQSKDGKVTLQFMVKSDVAGQVSIAINSDLHYSLLQTQSWKNDLDSTFRVDRTLKLTFNQIERVPVDAVTAASGRHAVLSTIRLDAGGQFGADRLLGAVEVHDGRQFATISHDFSVAQKITPSAELLKSAIQCTGVTAYCEADAAAEFYLELQTDDHNSPANTAPLAKANVSIRPADKNSAQPWTFAKFEKPAQLKPDSQYWIVAKGVRGLVRLGLKTAGQGRGVAMAVARGDLLLNRGGSIWKSLVGPLSAALEGLLSLTYVPDSDNQTAAVAIAVVEGGAAQQLDVSPSAKTVAFPASGAATPVLVIDSRGLGSLTIANVIQEYTLD
jgi:hypothetical protein